MRAICGVPLVSEILLLPVNGLVTCSRPASVAHFDLTRRFVGEKRTVSSAWGVRNGYSVSNSPAVSEGECLGMLPSEPPSVWGLSRTFGHRSLDVSTLDFPRNSTTPEEFAQGSREFPGNPFRRGTTVFRP